MNLRTQISLSYAISVVLILSACNCLSACAQLRQGSESQILPGPSVTTSTINPSRPASVDDDNVPKEPIGTKVGDILLVYPRGENNNKIDAPATFLVGTVTPGKKLYLGDQEIKTNADGYFAHVVKLAYGKNEFKLSAVTPGAEGMSIVVERPAPPPLLAQSTFNFVKDSLSPKEDMGATAGDIIQFSARATPGSVVTAKFGGHTIALKPAITTKKNGKPSVNLGLATTFGVSFQRSPAALKDLYLGFYKIAPDDNFQKSDIVFTLQREAQQTQAKSKGTISVVRQPILLSTAHANTIVRMGPGAARTTPLPESVRMMADGFIDTWWRLDLAPGKHVWIAKEDMEPDEDNTSPIAKVSTVNLESDAYGGRIVVPLNQRLPYQIEQDLAGGKLILHLFGTTSDTDFVTSDIRPGDDGSTDSRCLKLVDYVSWKQKGDQHYELTLQLKSKDQWGFYADYEDNKLVLHVKSAPAVDIAAGSLKGLVICVDPGHGGKEIGSIGCSGMKEATVNLALGKRFKEALEALGATVIMTREAEQFVSLQDRVDMAIASHADMLVSVHNNALPDGRDPWKEHGSSSYWYHTQSLPFARLARERLVVDGGLKDYGTRYQNLALCRPSNMIACLMEVGFMINPDEMSKLANPQFQSLIGKSLANSVKAYIYQKLTPSPAQATESGAVPKQ